VLLLVMRTMVVFGDDIDDDADDGEDDDNDENKTK